MIRICDVCVWPHMHLKHSNQFCQRQLYSDKHCCLLRVCFYVYVNLCMHRRNAKSTLFTCTTSENSCTAITKSTARITYCITVIAHTDSQDISSERRCQSGRIEGEVVLLLLLSASLFLSYLCLTLLSLCFAVMLYPVTLDSVKPVRGRPQCLNVTWISTLALFPVADSEVEKLKSQIEFTAEGQVSHSQICLNTFPYMKERCYCKTAGFHLCFM